MSRARSKSTRTVARRASPAGRPATKRSSAAAAYAPAVLKHALLGQLVTVLGCAGYDLNDCVKTFAAHAERQGKSARASSPGADPGLVDSAHVLTWWYTTPEYLDEFGSPRPLPFAGKCSFSALLNRALPEFDAEEVLAFLVRTGSVVREGSRFRPTRRDVVLDKQSEAFARLSLATVEALLGTILHNQVTASLEDRRLEAKVTNRQLPASAVKPFRQRATARGLELLMDLDSELARLERRAKPNEARVTVGVGAFLFESPKGKR